MAVTYTRDGDVAVVSISRPDVFNSINQAVTEGVAEALRTAGEQARAAVITGEGKAFCAGADLADLMEDYRAGTPDLERVIRARFNPLIRAVLEAPVPTVAAINGAAAGAGMGLALACDLRVMADSAFFMSAFINVALIPDSGTSWMLPHMVGVSRAMEITMSGRRVPAEEAAAIGLAHRVVPVDQVVEEAVSWARQLADGPTEAYLATRQLLHEAADTSLGQALEREAQEQGRLGILPAHLEGTAAFLEKRKPDFRKAE